jgi:hypothetical protein
VCTGMVDISSERQLKNYKIIIKISLFMIYIYIYTLLLAVNEQRNILHETSKRKANWIGHILCRNCLLQRVIEGKIKGGDRSDRKTRKKT